jgi:hypothetical protein
MARRWLIIALLNFLIAASLGALLRFAFVEEVSWLHFKNFLHAHSHVAMLGWVYMALFALLLTAFVPYSKIDQRAYNALFWVTQASVAGMLISFPLQGYGAVSIAFSCLHIICSYVFVAWLWTDLPKQKSFSHLLLKTAIVFMLLSTIAIWAMGPIMASSLKGSSFYYMAVQFYLHFQFNGWFLFGALALLFKILEEHKVLINHKEQFIFYGLLIVASLLTYALALAWAAPETSIFLANSLGVIVQLSALVMLIRLLRPHFDTIKNIFSATAFHLLMIAAISFVGKVCIQALVVVPFIAEAAYTIRNYVIGFIHLVLLGAISFSLFALASKYQLLQTQDSRARWGIIIVVAGFIFSETLLFLQGTMLWATLGFLPYYYEFLFGASFLLPLGILVFLFGQRRQIGAQKR